MDLRGVFLAWLQLFWKQRSAGFDGQTEMCEEHEKEKDGFVDGRKEVIELGS